MITYEKKDKPPITTLVVLSAAFPGAGHLAIKQTARGWAFVALSGVLFIAFFIKLVMIVAPINDILASGQPPEMTVELVNGMQSLMYLAIGGFVVWVAALVDIIMIGKRLQSGE